ncbi:hypothetical protein VUR80DRAFT_7264 [Thermomyces stellatus]
MERKTVPGARGDAWATFFCGRSVGRQTLRRCGYKVRLLAGQRRAVSLSSSHNFPHSFPTDPLFSCWVSIHPPSDERGASHEGVVRASQRTGHPRGTRMLQGGSRMRNGQVLHDRRNEPDNRSEMIWRRSWRGERRGLVLRSLAGRPARVSRLPTPHLSDGMRPFRRLGTFAHVGSPHPLGTPLVACPPHTPDLTGGRRNPNEDRVSSERRGGKGANGCASHSTVGARSGRYETEGSRCDLLWGWEGNCGWL